jgi:hypothetical protein
MSLSSEQLLIHWTAYQLSRALNRGGGCLGQYKAVEYNAFDRQIVMPHEIFELNAACTVPSYCTYWLIEPLNCAVIAVLTQYLM